uniref:Uncharacterized protein n=1 Tax=Oryza barthii TaxID=65489 RepID=A0A0D3ESB8_9ORYZ
MVTSRFGERQPPRRLLGDDGGPSVHGDGFFDGGGPSIDGTTTTKKASKGSYRRQEGGRNPRMHEYNKNGEKFRSARGPGGGTSRTRPEAKKAVGVQSHPAKY